MWKITSKDELVNCIDKKKIAIVDAESKQIDLGDYHTNMRRKLKIVVTKLSFPAVFYLILAYGLGRLFATNIF